MLDEADLSPRDRVLYEKLYASANDIGTARACAEYILKKGWHTFCSRGAVAYRSSRPLLLRH